MKKVNVILDENKRVVSFVEKGGLEKSTPFEFQGSYKHFKAHPHLYCEINKVIVLDEVYTKEIERKALEERATALSIKIEHKKKLGFNYDKEEVELSEILESL